MDRQQALRRKQLLLADMLRASQAIVDALGEGDLDDDHMEALSSTIDLRERLMEEIDELDAAVADDSIGATGTPARARVQAADCCYDGRAGFDRSEAIESAILRDISELLERLVRLQSTIDRLMMSRLEELGERVRGLRANRRAVSGYRQAQRGAGQRLVDQRR